MRNNSHHKVQIAGFVIYCICLTLSIYYVSTTALNNNKVKVDIILVLAEQSDDNSNESNSLKKFGSRFVGEEDDDDSAKDFMWHASTQTKFDVSNSFNPSIGYTSNPRLVNTPPPWC